MEILQSTFLAFIASVAFMIVFEVRGKAVVVGAVGGAISYLSFSLFQLMPNINYLGSYLFASVVLTLYSEIMARVIKKPATVFLTGALFPLVPGYGIYQSMLYFVEGKQADFFLMLQETLAITGVLAIGIMIVSAVFRSMRRNPFIKSDHIK